jgi:outer membrane receptor protein involved in Fe transport
MDQNSVYSNFIDVFDAITYVIPAAQVLIVGNRKEVQLRGQKSITGGVTTVLFIVNGVPYDDISFINPIEITSIKQLTSAQAAIYGARAGGGVIAITTK